VKIDYEGDLRSGQSVSYCPGRRSVVVRIHYSNEVRLAEHPLVESRYWQLFWHVVFSRRLGEDWFACQVWENWHGLFIKGGLDFTKTQADYLLVDEAQQVYLDLDFWHAFVKIHVSDEDSPLRLVLFY